MSPKLLESFLPIGLVAMLALAGCSSSGKNASAVSPNGSEASPEVPSQNPNSNSKSPTPLPVTLPQGTVLTVTIDQTLSSERSRSGEEFEASLSEPVILDGTQIIPRGARVRGRVTAAKSSGRLEHPGELGLSLTSVEVDGRDYNLRTISVTRKGESHKKRNAEMIGGGAAAGALIGALAGHGKGALIGTAVGAGAGTAGAAATGKKDVEIPAETRVSFRLREPVAILPRG